MAANDNRFHTICGQELPSTHNMSIRRVAATSPALLAALVALPAAADVRITEFMSEGQGLSGHGSGANR